MGKFLAWLDAVFGGSAEGGAAKAATQAVLVNPNLDEKLKHAAYRLDAIRRYIEQSEGVPAGRMREFFAETVAHADTLFRAGKIDRGEHDAIIDVMHSSR